MFDDTSNSSMAGKHFLFLETNQLVGLSWREDDAEVLADPVKVVQVMRRSSQGSMVR
jgi:hypothetical protein